ncbi:MAG: hypothetical protein AAF726_21865 [Planctomycetota bacterium]
MLTIAATAAGCATAPEPAVPDPTRVEAHAERFFDPPYLRGFVVSEDGTAVKAKVAIVRENGSSSTSSSGPFTLPAPKAGPAVLVATTGDGRIGWLPVDVMEEGPVSIVPDRAGGFLELVNLGEEAARVAVFAEDERLYDMTLHPDEPQTVVVPVGCVRFGLTRPEMGVREITVARGERLMAEFH